MIFAPIVQLITPRLKLRKLQLEDADDFFLFASDRDVCRYMFWVPHKSVEESKSSIDTSLLRYDNQPYYRWGIALKDSDRLIGIVQLLAFDSEESCCSFAYMISKDHWGNGYGPEALRAAMNFAFTKMQIRKITADHFSENTASGAAMRKAGMVYVKTIPGKYEKDGKQYDADQYEKTVP